MLLCNQGPAITLAALHCGHTGNTQKVSIAPGGQARVPIELTDGHRWYDYQVASEGAVLRLAGNVENGHPGISEPPLAYPHPD